MVQEEHGKEPSETESPLPGASDSAHRQIQGAQDALQGPFACSVRRFWAVWGVAWVTEQPCVKDDEMHKIPMREPGKARRPSLQGHGTKRSQLS